MIAEFAPAMSSYTEQKSSAVTAKSFAHAVGQTQNIASVHGWVSERSIRPLVTERLDCLALEYEFLVKSSDNTVDLPSINFKEIRRVSVNRLYGRQGTFEI